MTAARKLARESTTIRVEFAMHSYEHGDGGWTFEVVRTEWPGTGSVAADGSGPTQLAAELEARRALVHNVGGSIAP